MKKLFFAALALTAMVACSKDDVPTDDVLTSSEKSVTISIANMASGTRVFSGAPTANPQATATDWACTTVNENFYIFFLDNSTKIISKFRGDQLDAYGTSDSEANAANPHAGQWIFNGLPASVTQVVVAGNLTSNVPDVDDYLTASDWDITETDENITATWDAIKSKVVYATATLTAVMEGDPATQVMVGNYPLYRAVLEIAPQVARIEVTQISCTDFGTTDGFDAIGIKSIMLKGEQINPDPEEYKSYTYTFGTFTNDASVTGQYVITPDNDGDPATNLNVLSAGDGKAWAWNILPQATSHLITSLYVSGDGYTPIDPERTVTITSYTNKNTTPSTPITDFEKGKIYRFAIDFTHGNIDKDDNYIVADVTVTIANWVVVNTGVGFQTNP